MHYLVVNSQTTWPLDSHPFFSLTGSPSSSALREREVPSEAHAPAEPMAASLWLPQLPPPSLRSSLFLPSSSGSSCAPLCKKQGAPPTAASRGELLLLRSSSSTSSSVGTTQQQQEEAAPAAPEPAALGYQDDPNFRGCKRCGRAEVERGCNGEGRIQGGIAAVPGFGWWPIKAYRPCPGFVASGGRYRRQGQSMDDVASGRGKKVTSSGKNKRVNK